MTETELSREDDLRQLLTDAIEVQLAALKAGITFWTEWIEQTSAFVQSATRTLANLDTDEPTKDVILELVDAGRANARAITEIPRHSATKFLEELDRITEARTSGGGGGTRSRSARGTRRKRAGRAKA
ncbi:MAG: hypothetical protein IT361_04785 [Gemmatimonadaceae bacterium]|nr:hypothetical protein [Gemmatimonadaceae bacterium]